MCSLYYNILITALSVYYLVKKMHKKLFYLLKYYNLIFTNIAKVLKIVITMCKNNIHCDETVMMSR